MTTIVNNTVLNTGNFLRKWISGAFITKEVVTIRDDMLISLNVLSISLYGYVYVYHVVYLKYIQFKNE